MMSKSLNTDTKTVPAKEKEPFDPSICYTFFGSWEEQISWLETEADLKSQAYLLRKAISNYALYGIEPDWEDNPVMNFAWAGFIHQIDRSQAKRAQGFAAKKDPDETEMKILEAIADGDPYQTIGLRFGKSKSAVGRIKKKFHQQLEQIQSDRVQQQEDEELARQEAQEASEYGAYELERDDHKKKAPGFSSYYNSYDGDTDEFNMPF